MSAPVTSEATSSAGSYPPTRYSPPPASARIILVRHGTPEAYRPGDDRGVFDGQDDPRLAPEGREQAEKVGRYLAARGVTGVYTSPLRRAIETARPLSRLLGISPVVIGELREVHLGQWEGGLIHQRLNEGDPLWSVVLEQERWDAIPEAEDNESLRARVRSALTRIALAHPDGTVVAFTHDGVIAAALSVVTGSRPFAFASSVHASTSELVAEPPDRWRLRRFNSTAHLELPVETRR
ncbi:MAG: histidine phosphatase family protein [Actinomycetes bacterium]